MPEFESPRAFQIWSYTVSHGQLLLRANKSDVFTTRVEILFKDVLAINLTSTLNGLSICSEQQGRVSSTLGQFDLGNRNFYRVATADFEGYVVAGSFFVQEDHLDFDEPSTLLQQPHPS